MVSSLVQVICLIGGKEFQRVVRHDTYQLPPEFLPRPGLRTFVTMG